MEVAKLLTETEEVDIHINNDKALRIASMDGHSEMVEPLIHSADVYIINDESLIFDQQIDQTKSVILIINDHNQRL